MVDKNSNFFLLTFIFAIGWTVISLLFILVPFKTLFKVKTREIEKDMQNRAVSMIHGFVISGCAIYDVFFNDAWA